MKQIIFDNVAKGFPADENFMRYTDELRQGLHQLCASMFGDSSVILSGLYVTYSGSTNSVTTLSGGYVWAFGTMFSIERQVVSGRISPANFWIGLRNELMPATYDNGEVLPTYSDGKGYAVVSQDVGMQAAILRNLNSFRRVEGLIGRQCYFTPSSPDILSELRVSVGVGGISIGGFLTIPLSMAYNSWLSVGRISNIGVADAGRRVLLPAVVEVAAPNGAYRLDSTFTAYIEVLQDWSVRLFVSSQQRTMPEGHSATIHINTNYQL